VRLNLDRRAAEVGLLLATGYRTRTVRRLLLTEGLVLAALGGLLGLTACGSDAGSAPAAPEPGWSYTDARGVRVQLPERPERIVAYVAVAAVLWDYGVRPVGIFGPQRRDDGSPDTTADLLSFRALGLDLVEPEGGDRYWETLSWERAGRYAADFILHDTRAHSLQPDQLTAYPTWTTLPAVQAGQVGRWTAEVRLSAQGFAGALEELGTTVAASRDDVI
jgi:ABC-type Fe3+-hydroxamate transport system substrate-binding protein